MIQDLLSPLHLMVLAIVVLLVFGPKRLPELGSSAAKTIREFQRQMREFQAEHLDTITQALQQPPEDPTQAGQTGKAGQ